ncbi:MAG: endonuclease/exonuclease/phosphatase family protein [Motilibacteraceae bacterium]
MPQLTIGTWNLEQRSARSDRGKAQDRLLAAHPADAWLLTEVGPGRDGVAVSAPIAGRTAVWSAVVAPGAEPLSATHPTLAMARLHLDRTTVLLACSVLPWMQAGEHWPHPADGAEPTRRFAACLDAHLAEIALARGHALVVWGGDFNQPLVGSQSGFSKGCRQLLRDGLAAVGLVAATAHLHARTGSASIDHIAVPAGMAAEAVVRHLDGSGGSDHDAYLVSCPLS